MNTQTVNVRYTSSVKVPAGWRSIEITARAEKISAKRAKIIEVLTVDGESHAGYTSRTGANRQKYNAAYIEDREVGKVKNLLGCELVSAQ
jgi:hypothetical protein